MVQKALHRFLQPQRSLYYYSGPHLLIRLCVGVGVRARLCVCAKLRIISCALVHEIAAKRLVALAVRWAGCFGARRRCCPCAERRV